MRHARHLNLPAMSGPLAPAQLAPLRPKLGRHEIKQCAPFVFSIVTMQRGLRGQNMIVIEPSHNCHMPSL